MCPRSTYDKAVCFASRLLLQPTFLDGSLLHPTYIALQIRFIRFEDNVEKYQCLLSNPIICAVVSFQVGIEVTYSSAQGHASGIKIPYMYKLSLSRSLMVSWLRRAHQVAMVSHFALGGLCHQFGYAVVGTNKFTHKTDLNVTITHPRE